MKLCCSDLKAGAAPTLMTDHCITQAHSSAPKHHARLKAITVTSACSTSSYWLESVSPFAVSAGWIYTHWSIMFGSNSDDCLLMYAHTMYASTVNAPHVPQCCWPHLVFPFKRIGIICEFWGEMIMIIILRGEKIWHRTWGVCHIKKSGNKQGH